MPQTLTLNDVLTKRQRYERIYTSLVSERSSFLSIWRDVGDQIFPVRMRSLNPSAERNRGERKNQKIIDSTGTFAANTLRAGLHAGMTSPSRPWFILSVPDPALGKIPAVKAWLYEVSERMRTVIALSNAYTAFPLTYGDMGIFGTAAMGMLADPGDSGRPGDLFRCYPYPIGSYVLGVDNRGLATTFIRDYAKTVGQLIEEFGGDDGQPAKRGKPFDRSRFSTAVMNAWDKGDYETNIDLRWYVLPNRDYDANDLGVNALPWTSCHLEASCSENKFLRESGFNEFPILAPRWYKNAEDTYGTDCPGITALGDIRQLQIQQKRKGQAVEKLINPPLIGGPDVRTQAVSLLPGGVTVDNGRDPKAWTRPLHEVKPDLAAFVGDIQEVQYRINRAFYVDLFQMLSQMDQARGAQPPTAREIDERHEEKLLMLGPVLDSTEDELLDPFIDRLYGMMDRANMIPPPPPDLEGVELVPEYTSILAQAQKFTKVAIGDRFLQTMGSAAAFMPAVLHKLNPNAIADGYRDDLGIDPAWVLTDDEANANAEAAAKAQQQAMAAEQLKSVGQGAQALSNTQMNSDSALSRILEGVQG